MSIDAISDAEKKRFDGMTPPPFPMAGKAALATIGLLVVMVGIHQITGESSPRSTLEPTKVTMKASMGLLTEYEVRTTFAVEHRFPTLAMYAKIAQGQPVPDSWIEQMVSEISTEKDVAQGLRSLGSDAFIDTDGDGFMEILDGWGRPMIYVNSVSHKDGFLADDFMPEHRSPYLYSAGPDGKFGDVNDPKDTTWQDNLSSFSLE